VKKFSPKLGQAQPFFLTNSSSLKFKKLFLGVDWKRNREKKK
jgi:hypothetical protein